VVEAEEFLHQVALQMTSSLWIEVEEGVEGFLHQVAL